LLSYYAGSDTTYLSTVDRDGNMVSLIQSNFSYFGAGIGVEGGGFVLHNRGALFTLDPRSPNVLAGRKRPLHTIIPGFIEKGDIRIAFGIMGGGQAVMRDGAAGINYGASDPRKDGQAIAEMAMGR
jgi:gamma-glutamyltranspeptidase